jgi:hypothetical protein
LSTMTKGAIEKDLERLQKLTGVDARTKEVIRAEIQELETSMRGIKSERAKQAVQKEIDVLTAEYEAPVKENPYQEYRANLKSLMDGYTKILAVMQVIPFYVTAQRGRAKGTKIAKVAGTKRPYNKKAK